MALEQTGLEFIAEGSEAFDRALNSASDAVTGFGDIAGDVAGAFGTVFEEVVIGALRHVGEIAVDTLLQAGQAAIEFGTASFTGALEAEEGILRLNRAIDRQGVSSAVTKDKALEYADSFKNLVGGSDDTVIAIEAVLLRVEEMSASTFPKAIQASADLAAVLRTDPVDAANQLARALGNPEAASRLLRQANIFLTDSEKDLLKTWGEAGNAAAAQEFIIDKLNQKVGGEAVAASKTLSGQWAIFTETIADAGEQVGTKFIPILLNLFDTYIKPNLPVITDLIDKFGEWALVMTGELIKSLEKIGNWLTTTGIPAFIQIKSVVDKFLSGDFSAITKLIPPEIMSRIPELQKAVEQLVAAVVKHWPEMVKAGESFMVWIQQAFGIIAPALIDDLIAIITIMADIWDKHGASIIETAKLIAQILMATLGTTLILLVGIVKTSLQQIQGAFDFFSAVFQGRWLDAWKIAENNFKTFLSNISTTFQTAMNFILSIAGTDLNRFLDNWRTIFSMIGTIVSQSVTNLGNSIIQGISGALNQLRNIGQQFQAIGANIIKGIIDGIRNTAQQLIQSLFQTIGSAVSGITGLLRIHSPSEFTADKIGLPMGMGIAAGIAETAKSIELSLSKSVMSGIDSISQPLQTIPAGNSQSYSRTNNYNYAPTYSGQPASPMTDFNVMKVLAT